MHKNQLQVDNTLKHEYKSYKIYAKNLNIYIRTWVGEKFLVEKCHKHFFKKSEKIVSNPKHKTSTF